MKKILGWGFNILLIVVGGFLIYTYFQPEETVSRSEPIIVLLNDENYDEAFRQIQQVTLNDEDKDEIKTVLLRQTLRARDELNEERLLVLNSFISNVPFDWGPSFHMPILSNIQFYLDDIDRGYIVDCHEDSDFIIQELQTFINRFIDSILPYYRNGLAQALNNARTHYNNALDLQDALEACYSPLNYSVVLEAGLSFMNETLENPALSNYTLQRDTYNEIKANYDEEVSALFEGFNVISSRLNTLNLYEEQILERLN